MNDKRRYDSTVARMAGNIAAGLVGEPSVRVADDTVGAIAHTAVVLARAIIAEVERTEPKSESH